MSWQASLWLGVGSSLLPIMIAGVARTVWSRRRVPTALTRAVRRGQYLGAVLAESRRADITALDVLAPRLTPAAGGPRPIGAIQAAWKEIDKAGAVRVVTLDSDECLQAGAELLVGGIEVRVTPRDWDKEGLSYHLFHAGTAGVATALANHHQGGKDRPVRVSGVAATQVFHDHFDKTWAEATPLESFLAERIIARARAGAGAGPGPVLTQLDDTVARLHLDAHCIEQILPHLAFRHGSPVIFVVGLPGSGKSFVRQRLNDLLTDKLIKTHELPDYVFLYLDYVHGRLGVDPPRGEGYEPHCKGAFSVKDESVMVPALQSLARAVRESMIDNEVTLVEFARADLGTALQEFDGISANCRVIHVSAPEALRADRIARRAVAPQITIDGGSIRIEPSDNHLLPSPVERTVYSLDDIDRLASLPRWRDRIWKIENSVDDHGGRVDHSLAAFVDGLVNEYRPPANGRHGVSGPGLPNSRSHPRVPAPTAR